MLRKKTTGSRHWTMDIYEAASLSSEGFIHLSRQEQVEGVLNRYYKNKKDLLLLHVDESKLAAPLKYELAPSVNETFPPPVWQA